MTVQKMTYNDIEVSITGELSEQEIAVYLDQLQEKNTNKIISANLTVDGDFVDIHYQTSTLPFERIRRITGYLVGTTAKWNNAKRQEEQDRTRHQVS